jgi:hypothetical protein
VDKWKTEFQGSKVKYRLKKRIKNCRRNMQELCNSIKSPNLLFMGITEGEEVQVKGIGNIFNKIK